MYGSFLDLYRDIVVGNYVAEGFRDVAEFKHILKALPRAERRRLFFTIY